MRPTLFTLVVWSLLVGSREAQATSISPLDMEKLKSLSAYIVLGEVEEVKRLNAMSDEVRVRIATVLKGETGDRTKPAKRGETTFTMILHCRGGWWDYDPELKVGDKGVFFLKSLKDGKAEKTYWGSVSIFPRGESLRMPKK